MHRTGTTATRAQDDGRDEIEEGLSEYQQRITEATATVERVVEDLIEEHARESVYRSQHGRTLGAMEVVI